MQGNSLNTFKEAVNLQSLFTDTLLWGSRRKHCNFPVAGRGEGQHFSMMYRMAKRTNLVDFYYHQEGFW